ncbi:MAG TPA: fibronectin type III domain-containing protein, partial [Solirubrobacteraceae bacterium]|nr:fibronectin type III domain-containing protein [Solirubrobacteraceae bacterium]
FASHVVSASVTGLVPNALYHVRIVATNSAGSTFGPDVTFTTGKLPAPGSPALGRTFNISLVSGVVLVKVNGKFIPLTELTQIPKNTVINALHGTLSLTSAAGGPSPARDAAAKGKKHKTKTQKGNFGGAVFKISQTSAGAGKGLVTLAIVENAFKGAPSYATCKAHTALEATAASSKTLQLLHASAKGKFRTKGKYSAATVLGTKWTVADRCDGTLTHDVTDSVQVNDFVHHKTIVLHAGQSYLAKAPKHK